LANDEAGADFGRRVYSDVRRFEAREELVDGLGGEVTAGHTHGGEGRDGVLREVNVIEADEGEVVGNAQVGFEEGVLDADGGHVVGAHDGGWPSGQREDLVHGIAAAVECVIAFDEPLGIGLEAGGLEAAEECGLAALGGAAGERAADEADVAVAENREVLDAFVDAGAIVDGENAVEGSGGSGVDEDEGDIVGGEAVEEKVLDAEGHDGDTVDLALEHAPRAEFHGLALVVGRADEDFVTARDGDVFEFLDEFWEEGVSDFRDDETEQAAFAGDEGAGLGVGKVVEIGNSFPDAGGKDGVDGGNVVDGTGDGGDGDAGKRSYAADIDLGRSGDVSRLAGSFHVAGDLEFCGSAYASMGREANCGNEFDYEAITEVSYRTENVYTRQYFDCGASRTAEGTRG